MATPKSGEKTMSSRLLTMKFMQRGISSQSSPVTSTSSQGPPSKRIRLSNGAASPVVPSAYQTAVQAALEAEEQKRIEALERHAADNGETRWVLGVKDLPRQPEGFSVVSASFADIDALAEEDTSALGDGDSSEEEEEDSTLPSGRRMFGKLERAPARQADQDSGSSVSSSDDDDDAEADGDNPVAQSRREARKKHEANLYASQRARQAEEKHTSMLSRPKEVKLSSLKSISGGRGASSASNRSRDDVKCYKCGRTGHIRNHCPN